MEKKEKIHEPFKKKVHLDKDIWTYKVGVSNSVILSPDGKKKYIVAHSLIAKKNTPIEHSSTKVEKRSRYTVNPALIKSYIEKNLKHLPVPNKHQDSLSVSWNKHQVATPLNPGNSKSPQSYGILLRDSGPAKLSVVKEIKDIFNLGLKECKDIIDNTPYNLARVSRPEAEKIASKLRAVGATVEIY